jgi:peptidoglycan/xylan/chitin deacetylase (PgdA/CDA1 family)
MRDSRSGTGQSGLNQVSLTFDDGPGPSTERLLEVLAYRRVRATFFVLGCNLRGDAWGGDAVRAHATAIRAVRDGHVLGNHTMSHAPELPADELLAEVAACDRLVRRCYAEAGRPAPATIPVRLPYGPFRRDGQGSLAALERIGRPHCHWTGDPQDFRAERGADQIAALMLRHVEKFWQLGRTPTLLLHDAGHAQDAGGEHGVVREATVDAVDAVCATLAARNTRFVTVLEQPPPAYRWAAAAPGPHQPEARPPSSAAQRP